MRTIFGVGVLLAVAATAAGGGEPARQSGGGPTAADLARVAQAAAPGLVKVEWTLQFDKGEPPQAAGWAQRCPNCGRYHGFSSEESIREERPLEAGGVLVGPTTVVTADPMVHARFVKGVEVRFGEKAVAATVSAYAREQSALFLELSEALPGTAPVAFQADLKPPYLSIQYGRLNGSWTASVQPLSTAVSVVEGGRRFVSAPSGCLVVDQSGAAAALVMAEDLPLDDSWKGSPQAWPRIAAAEMDQRSADLEKRLENALPRVRLSFRSPKKSSEARPYMYRGGSADESATELDVLGILTGKQQVLVLASLKPDVTARLERIQVYGAAAEPVAARFMHSLTNYGALVAELEAPLEGPLALSARNILDLRRSLLPAAEVKVQGEKRQWHFGHRRIAGFEVGWKQHLHPELPGRSEGLFLFDEAGALVAFPICRREKVSVEERWSSETPLLTAAADLGEVLASLTTEVDPSNAPLSEEEENRLAWMGVELQALNRELARINNVSHLTNDGRTGGIVSWVYPGSPAEKAGVKPGDVLLRLHAPDHPKPIEVTVEEGRYGGETFPWERLDELPEQYYDQIPRPWPSVETGLNRALTRLGFGKTYTAEFVREGKSLMLAFEAVQSPAHHDMAPKFKSADLGLTVRDLTYEVRRYLQKREDEPGVVVAKIETGSKASVAGLKPYELITHVNDQAVMNVKDFERLIGGQEELRLQVKRMARGRVVKIKTGGAGPQPAAPSPGGAPEEPE